jgi:hypothetical protein
MLEQIVAWASDADNSNFVRTICALFAVPGGLWGAYLFLQWLRGRGLVRQLDELRDSIATSQASEDDRSGRGGDGGSGKIVGGEGVIIGGTGGSGGPVGAGRGGDGGSGSISGGGGLIIGGAGGEAGQYGRGGRGGMSPLAAFGLDGFILPDGRRLSDFGRGGDGAAPPIQHQGRLYRLSELLRFLPEEVIRAVDATKSQTSQIWWDELARA